jgi:hypothetical protein
MLAMEGLDQTALDSHGKVSTHQFYPSKLESSLYLHCDCQLFGQAMEGSKVVSFPMRDISTELEPQTPVRLQGQVLGLDLEASSQDEVYAHSWQQTLECQTT